jgi:dTMP kinase
LLDTLRAAIQKGLEPDLTLLLDAPLEVGASRIGDRKPDHFEREQRPFFERVRAAYLSLAAQHRDRIKIIDAAVPLPQVQRQIKTEITALVRRLQMAQQ